MKRSLTAMIQTCYNKYLGVDAIFKTAFLSAFLEIEFGVQVETNHIAGILVRMSKQGVLRVATEKEKRENGIVNKKQYWVKIKDYNSADVPKIPRKKNAIVSTARDIVNAVHRLEQRKNAEVERIKEEARELREEVSTLLNRNQDLEKNYSELYDRYQQFLKTI